MHKLTIINFNGQELNVTQDENGNVFVGMKAVCEGIGLSWHGQFERIQRDSVLNSATRMIRMTAQDGKNYEMISLPIELLNGWLFGIDDKRVKEEIRPALIKYKKECYSVLNDYFHKGVAVNEQFPNIENILEQSLSTIRTQRLQLSEKAHQITTMQPTVDFVENIFKPSKVCRKIGEFAKTCSFKHPNGSIIGPNQLFDLLRKMGILMWGNQPKSEYLKAGYFELKESVNKEKNIAFAPTTLITTKGQEWLYRKVRKYLKNIA